MRCVTRVAAAEVVEAEEGRKERGSRVADAGTAYLQYLQDLRSPPNEDTKTRKGEGAKERRTLGDRR